MNKFTPIFRAAIHEGARKCFGYLEVTTYRTGFKVFKTRRSGPLMADHYMPPMEPQFRKYVPDFKSEQEERDAEAYLRRKRKGIVPPKKGQGKRATKGKKKAAAASDSAKKEKKA